MKYLALLPVAFMLGTPAIAETINPYQEKGCVYDGDVGKDGKPSGKGTWKCQDGRSYVGAFKNGKFDGKGVYTVSDNSETFIEPFSSNSAKLRNMTLEGVFKKGRAHGNFTASQNGTPVFIMKCSVQRVKLLKAKRSASVFLFISELNSFSAPTVVGGPWPGRMTVASCSENIFSSILIRNI